jgi:hypothetical protein
VKGPALGGCPEATSSHANMGQTTTCTSRGLLQMQPEGTFGKKAAPHLAHHQDPVHNVVKMDSGGSTAPLCLYKVGQSLTPILTRLKVSWTSWTWRQKTDIAL